MNTADLQAFIAVAEHGSFSRAAEVLHLTQPAVSKRVAALEGRLDARLFDRIGRQIALTEAGRALLPRARHILAEIDESRRVLADLTGETRGRLSLATSHHIGLHRLPPVLRAFAARHPAVELDLHFMDSEQACAKVEHGDIELAVVTLPTAPSARLLLTPLWNDPLDIAVARDHPLAGEKRPGVDALAAYPAIMPSVGTFTRAVIVRAFEERGLALRVAMETNHMETIRMMVSIGLGWSALPRTMFDEEIVPLKIADLALERTLGLIRHRDRTLSNAARAMEVVLGEHADGTQPSLKRRGPHRGMGGKD